MSGTVVFIDSRLADYQALASGVAAGAQVIILDGGKDGLAQIRSHLDGRSGIDAIHVISHGSAGTLYLGTTVLDAASLGSYAEDLRVIGGSLTGSGDMLFYACNLAAGDAGLSFVGRLADLTGADVSLRRRT